MFSHKYTEKQLYKLGVSDEASWLNSQVLDFYGLCQHIEKLFTSLQKETFLKGLLITIAAQDTKMINLIFQRLKTCLRKKAW